MQRLPSVLLSIILGLLLGFGPMVSAAPAMANGWSADAGESHLPACCRRHGVHHCNMDAGAGFSLAGHTHETTVSANGCCPCWPGLRASATAPFAAVFTHRIGPAIAIELRSAPQAEIAAGMSERRTWPQRGPPTQNL